MQEVDSLIPTVVITSRGRATPNTITPVICWKFLIFKNSEVNPNNINQDLLFVDSKTLDLPCACNVHLYTRHFARKTQKNVVGLKHLIESTSFMECWLC